MATKFISQNAIQEGAYYNPYKLFTGSFIPEWLEVRPEVTCGAKLVFGKLCRFAGKKGECFPKIQTIAESIGLKKRQVQRYIRELEGHHLIEVIEAKSGKIPNTYRFISHRWMYEAPSKDMSHKTPLRGVINDPRGVIDGTEGCHEWHEDMTHTTCLHEEYMVGRQSLKEVLKERREDRSPEETSAKIQNPACGGDPSNAPGLAAFIPAVDSPLPQKPANGRTAAYGARRATNGNLPPSGMEIDQNSNSGRSTQPNGHPNANGAKSRTSEPQLPRSPSRISENQGVAITWVDGRRLEIYREIRGVECPNTMLMNQFEVSRWIALVMQYGPETAERVVRNFLNSRNSYYRSSNGKSDIEKIVSDLGILMSCPNHTEDARARKREKEQQTVSHDPAHRKL